MLRGAGAGLMVCAGLWLGREMARFWSARRCSLEACGALFQYLLDAVQYQRLPAEDILARLKREGDFAVFLPAECAALRQLVPPGGLTTRQAAHFSSCIRAFGRQGLEGQCEQLRREIAYFARCAEGVREREKAAAAICPRVGLCVGMMLALALF